MMLRRKAFWWAILDLRREMSYLPDEAARACVWAEAEQKFATNAWHVFPLLLITIAAFSIGISLGAWIAARLVLGPLVGRALRLGLGFAGLFAAGYIYYSLVRRRYQHVVRKLVNEAGVPVCLACGYNLTGLSERRCPECGRTAKVQERSGAEP